MTTSTPASSVLKVSAQQSNPWGTLLPCVYPALSHLWPLLPGFRYCCWVFGVADLKVNLWQTRWRADICPAENPHSNTEQGTLILYPEQFVDKWKDLEVVTPP